MTKFIIDTSVWSEALRRKKNTLNSSETIVRKIIESIQGKQLIPYYQILPYELSNGIGLFQKQRVIFTFIAKPKDFVIYSRDDLKVWLQIE